MLVVSWRQRRIGRSLQRNLEQKKHVPVRGQPHVSDNIPTTEQYSYDLTPSVSIDSNATVGADLHSLDRAVVRVDGGAHDGPGSADLPHRAPCRNETASEKHKHHFANQ